MTPAPDAAAPPGALSRPEFIALVAALMSLNALAIAALGLLPGWVMWICDQSMLQSF